MNENNHNKEIQHQSIWNNLKKKVSIIWYFICLNSIQFGLDFGILLTSSIVSTYSYDDKTDQILITFQPNSFGLNQESAFASILSIVIQLVIGSMSDNSHYKKGKRRIFVVVGCIIYVSFLVIYLLMMILIYFTLKDNLNGSQTTTPLLKLLLISFTSLLIPLAIAFSNIMRVSYRAYILDEFDSEYQTSVYTMASFVSGFARLCVGISQLIMWSVFISKFNDNSTTELSDILVFCFKWQIGYIGISILLMPLCIYLFCKFAKETHFENDVDNNVYEDIINSSKIKRNSSNNYMKSFCKCCCKCSTSIPKYFKQTKQDIKSLFKNSDWSLRIIILFTTIGWFYFYLSCYYHDGNLMSLTVSKEGNQWKRSYIIIIDNIIQSLMMIIGSVIMFISKKNSKYHCTFIFILTTFSCLLFYAVQDDFIDGNGWQQFINYILSSIPMMLSSLLLAYLYSLPYAFLRDVVNESKFGVSVGIIYVVNSIISVISITFSSILKTSLCSSDIHCKNNEGFVLPSTIKTIVAYPIIFGLFGILISRLLPHIKQDGEVIRYNQQMNFEILDEEISKEHEN